MSKGNWGNERYDPRHDPQPEERGGQIRRKKTKQWCKGKLGVPHRTEIVIHHRFVAEVKRRQVCHELPWYAGRWWCMHAEQCTRCGKYLQWMLKRDDCPVYQELNSR